MWISIGALIGLTMVMMILMLGQSRVFSSRLTTDPNYSREADAAALDARTDAT